jgi:hypothetical protein
MATKTVSHVDSGTGDAIFDAASNQSAQCLDLIEISQQSGLFSAHFCDGSLSSCNHVTG